MTLISILPTNRERGIGRVRARRSTSFQANARIITVMTHAPTIHNKVAASHLRTLAREITEMSWHNEARTSDWYRSLFRRRARNGSKLISHFDLLFSSWIEINLFNRKRETIVSGLLEVEVFEGEMDLHDSRRFYPGPENILFRWLVFPRS